MLLRGSGAEHPLIASHFSHRGAHLIGEILQRQSGISQRQCRAEGVGEAAADRKKLDGAVTETLSQPASAKGAAALATILVAPGDETTCAAVRACEPLFAGEVGVSAWNGIAVARFCARDGTALRRDVIAVLAALKRADLPRLWLS